MKVFCQNIIINKLSFERNMKELDNAGIEMGVIPELAKNRDENEKKVRLEAEITIGEKGRTSFHCEMNIISILNWEGNSDNFDETIIKLGMPFIMSFARVKVFELCQQAGIKPVYLPELD